VLPMHSSSIQAALAGYYFSALRELAMSAPLLAEARAHAEGGEHLRACAALTKAKRLEPSNPAILIDLARSLLQLHKLSKALAAADDAIRLDPVGHQAYHVRALVLIELGRLEEAIDALGQALQLGADGSDAERLLAQTKWMLKSQHDQAGTECPASAADAEKPEEPPENAGELSARDKMAFKRAQCKKSRQSKHARGQIEEKGRGVTEVLSAIAKDADSRVDTVLKELGTNALSSATEGGAGGSGPGGEGVRYSAERVGRFVVRASASASPPRQLRRRRGACPCLPRRC
jgi:tetratricopeptide (TPR) repeat protein